MKFFNRSDCCGGSAQTGNATPVNPLPVEGSLICDDRYLTLPNAPRGKMLVIASGSNCQTFLGGDNSGVLAYDSETGETYVSGGNQEGGSGANALTIPLDPINPAVGGVFPQPGEFKYLVGAGPGAGLVPTWFFVAAPSTGNWMIQVIDGEYVFVNAGSVPGLIEIGESNDEREEGRIVVMTREGPANWGLHMLTVQNRRVIIGVIDAGVKSYRPIAEGEPLEHPFINVPSFFQTYRYGQLDSGGAQIPGGLPILITSGVGVVADSVVALYSPTAKKFYRMPPPVREAIDYDVEVAVADDGAWHTMGAHCTMSATFENPNFFVAACIRAQTKDGSNVNIDGDYNMQFGLFIDGIIAFWWQIKGGKDNSLTRLVKGVSVGVNHTIDIRVNKANVAGEHLFISVSNMDVFSVL